MSPRMVQPNMCKDMLPDSKNVPIKEVNQPLLGHFLAEQIPVDTKFISAVLSFVTVLGQHFRYEHNLQS